MVSGRHRACIREFFDMMSAVASVNLARNTTMQSLTQNASVFDAMPRLFDNGFCSLTRSLTRFEKRIAVILGFVGPKNEDKEAFRTAIALEWLRLSGTKGQSMPDRDPA